jgi:hypothetical protein
VTIALIPATILGLFALLLGAVVRRRIKTGSITASSHPGLGSGGAMREKHPVLFWLWNVQLIGATLFVSAVAILCVTEAIGLTHFSDAIEGHNAPNP